MSDTLSLPYQDRSGTLGGGLSFVPITLSNGQNSETAHALLDSGATVNVLPYSLGIRLGLVWESQSISMRLTGNMASLPAFGVLLQGELPPLTPVMLAFAWIQTDAVPVILGQTNFFQEFNVCFFRSRSEVEVRRKS